MAPPLDKTRLKVVVPDLAKQWPRTEQRATTKLLAAIPEEIRKDVISSRRLSPAEILFKLLTTYQPGGPQERTQLLRDVQLAISAPSGASATSIPLRCNNAKLRRNSTDSKQGTGSRNPLKMLGLVASKRNIPWMGGLFVEFDHLTATCCGVAVRSRQFIATFPAGWSTQKR